MERNSDIGMEPLIGGNRLAIHPGGRLCQAIVDSLGVQDSASGMKLPDEPEAQDGTRKERGSLQTRKTLT